MLRALSTRRNPHRYERLGDDPAIGLLEGKLKRAASVPARVLASSSRKLRPEVNWPELSHPKPTKKSTTNTTKNQHPLFSLFNARRRKKTTAKPEFARYIEYVKEGGMWDGSSNVPVIYYK